ncbi:peptidyl-prolyl cis-trans isomerase [Planctomycetales bacterium]|nr:peptidyl-prolyl cis-trans isomerase [Planctomycetales bacterium]
MKKFMSFTLLSLAAFLLAACGADATSERTAVAKSKKKKSVSAAAGEKPAQVKLTTNVGEIVIELFPKEAPISTANFLAYTRDGFYAGTIFHRVIPNFMIQGGGMDGQLHEKDGKKAPIKNEADNGLKNLRGTLAMARTGEVNSATSQFFINLKDNAFLDHGARDFGYAVFGKVVKGMEIVDKIALVRTGNAGFHQDVPQTPIVIEKAEVVE